MWGAISGAMNPKFCFVAGTLVMTKQGLKAIAEEIAVKLSWQSLNYRLILLGLLTKMYSKQ